MADNKPEKKQDDKPVKYKLKVDVQCGVCGALSHLRGDAFPKFCPGCGAAMERFCLKCHKKAEMYFEEWWPEDDECLRTYSPPKRCPGCNAMLDTDGDDAADGPGYKN